jgi:hypothetical protein
MVQYNSEDVNDGEVLVHRWHDASHSNGENGPSSDLCDCPWPIWGGPQNEVEAALDPGWDLVPPTAEEIERDIANGFWDLPVLPYDARHDD